MHLFVVFMLSTFVVCETLSSRSVFTNHWAVRIIGGPKEADKLASKYGFTNLGQIGGLEDHYHFHHSRVVRRSTFAARGAHSFIHMDPKVGWIQQQIVKSRVKRYARSDPDFIYFNDPKWSKLWYIHSGDKTSQCRSEMNILAAWQRGYTGRNVVVTILDDGIERNHPDLAQNYDQLASYDFNGNDHDPTPRYDSSNENKHGTRCAGEVAAVANNSHCVVGIAYNARIGGIRMLDGDVTDVVEAKSLGIRPDYIDIYSASWGPDDDGKTVDGPGPLAKQAFEVGIKKGRKGLGSIFVWASGNGGRQGDHCSCDGYTNSIYTISVSSSTENGNKPWYLEVCSSTLATTYSSGEFYDRKIVTTDLRQRCTDGHTGTSVSAPMVAGVIALTLEANRLITWRDVQHLLVKTSRPVHLQANDWKTNAAGHKVSHLFGFGLVDAEAMVIEAKKWRSVPPHHTCTKISDCKTTYIRPEQTLNATISSTGCSEQPEHHVAFLEHVVVRVFIDHPRRGDLEISLVSPAGTRSQLLLKRLFDNSNEGFKNWEFMTVHCWGERAEGTWTLEISDSPSQLRNPEVLGKMKEWTLILYGTAEHPYQSHGSHSRSHMLEVSSVQSTEPTLGIPQPEEQEEEETCISHCPLGYFEDVEARRCRRCHRGCERCVGHSPHNCRSCRRGLFFYALESSCVAACPSGYFPDDGESEERIEEPSNCYVINNTISYVKYMLSLSHDLNPFQEIYRFRCFKKQNNNVNYTFNDSFNYTFFLTGPGMKECIHCAQDFLLQEWRCVRKCAAGYYECEKTEFLKRMCCKCNCGNCQGPGASCTQCRNGYNLVDGTCIVSATCNNGRSDEVFCEMVKFNRLCEKKLFRQFCCRTCRLAG
uniref:Proprotein convertase subtilisin/kexin type 6 n=1 Tax=Electrophorus electricus TaxID=8005 RepID=A0A4W4G6Q5_ELEEL